MSVSSVRKLYALFAMLILISGCATTEKAPDFNLTYPYHATDERTQRIKGNYRRIAVGMNANQVEAILGAPDKELPLFEPKISKPRQIGRTQWYFVQRLKAYGSASETADILVRVSYDLKGHVTRIDHWGFDEKTANQALQHNDPSCHGSCLRTLRASRGRG